jgi:hypothetical protein
LELLVVLTILIALGGIVVTTLPGILEQTQVATTAANVPQIDSSIRQSALLHQGRVGDRFDALLTGDGLDGDVAPYVGGHQYFQTVSLTAGDIQALNRIGITELVPAADSPVNATFDSHQQPPVPLSADANLVAVDSVEAPAMAMRLWNFELPEGAKIVVMGIGSQCTLVGSGREALFSEAPVHFSDNQSTNPKNMYSRYLAVFELAPRDEKTSSVRYIGTCAPGPQGLQTVSQTLKDHYNDQL